MQEFRDRNNKLAEQVLGVSRALLPEPERVCKDIDRNRDIEELFWGMKNSGLPLWESVCLSEEERFLNARTLAVKQWYLEAGITVKEEIRQLDDHIGIECAFMAWLLLSGQKQQSQKFWEEHLRPFMNKFSSLLKRQACSVHYQNLADELFEMSSRMKIEMTADANTAAALPDVFRELTETERRLKETEQITQTCGLNNCGGRCPIRVRHQDGCILEIMSDNRSEEDGIPQIRACARGLAYHQTFLSPQRLRYPMKRIGARGEGRFKRISWTEALDYIEKEWIRIRDDYGPASRYVSYGYGADGVLKGLRFMKNLLALDGGYLDYYNSYSSACARIATPYTFGTNIAGNSSSQLVHSQLIILWGHNPSETQFGSLTTYYIKKAKEAGARVIAVDPRRSDTARGLADQWIALRPTTDCALMAGIAWVILTEQRQNQVFMDRYCIGFDKCHMPEGYETEESFEDYIMGYRDGVAKTPEWAEKITGVSQEVIIGLAREYAAAKPAAIVQGLGPQRHGNGEQVIRFGAALACLTGNIGIPGGETGCSGQKHLRGMPEAPAIKNPLSCQIPVFLWTDAIIRGTEMNAVQDGLKGVEKLETNIKMLFSVAGNTLINQHSDINRTKEILKDTSLCECIVCSDIFMTSSAKYADILLPGISMFEGNNLASPWEDGDYILGCNQIIKPLFEAKFDYEWMSELAERLGYGEAFTSGQKSTDERLEEVYQELQNREPELPPYKVFMQQGGYYYKGNPESVAFRHQIEEPDRYPFPTPSGKIEIFSAALKHMNNPKEIPALPKYVPSFEGPEDPARKKYPLQLIGWHTKRRCHTVHEQNKWLEEAEPPALRMHCQDAADRGISEGDMVEIWNDRGRVRMPVTISEEIIQGTAAMAQGAWYTPDKDGTDIRGSINVLTTARPTPLAKGNPQHSNLVEVRKAAKRDGERWNGSGTSI